MSRPKEQSPEFFVDRSLGKSIVAERDALTEAAVRVFCLTNRHLRGTEQTERFISNRHRIRRQARKSGPYIYGVYEKGLKRLWP